METEDQSGMVVRARVSPETLARLEELCEITGMTKSDVIRYLINNAEVKKISLTVPVAEVPAVKEE